MLSLQVYSFHFITLRFTVHQFTALHCTPIDTKFRTADANVPLLELARSIYHTYTVPVVWQQCAVACIPSFLALFAKI